MTWLGRRFLLEDREAFRAFLTAQAAREPQNLVMAHGELLSREVGRHLREAAGRL